MTTLPARVECLPCRAYLKIRGSRIQREVLRLSRDQAGYSATGAALRFLRGLHARHEAGLPLTFPDPTSRKAVQ